MRRVRHSRFGEDHPLEKLAVGLAARHLQHAGEHRVAGGAVGLGGTRREEELCLLRQLRHAGGGVRGRLLGVGRDAVGDSGAVGEEHADIDLLATGKVGKPLRERVGRRKGAGLDQTDRDDQGHGLGHRGDAEPGAPIHRHRELAIGQPERPLVEDVLAACDPYRARDLPGVDQRSHVGVDRGGGRTRVGETGLGRRRRGDTRDREE